MNRREFEEYLSTQKGDLIAGLNSYHRRWNRELVERAFDFAVEAHHDQWRHSGEPFVVHPIEVARILTELKTDYIAVAGGLLHDVVEDTGVTIEDVEEKFGPGVSLLVDGVTKISEIRFRSYQERQAESLRKMLLSMLKDLRVILIKFADRLHNMRTLDSLPQKSQERISLETRDVYAPLAYRLGIARIAREMEELALLVLDPDSHKVIKERVQSTVKQRQMIIEEIIAPINRELERHGINADVRGRVKSISSIYNKIQKRGKAFDEILDLLAIRMIVGQKSECYRVLGIVHDIYTPVTDHFTDYIALPKSNLYQSLHTKVRDKQNRIVEVQIRTHEMNALAENGIAAHWRYKAGKWQPDELDEHFAWIRSLMEAHQEGAETGDFLESLKINLFHDEIFVFTPQGKLIQLPSGSTPIDLAFAIHSDIGLHAIGAKVGGKVVHLSQTLESGDVVEILTSHNQRPSVEWLKFVRTSRARSRIKRWFRETRWEQAKSLGEEMINTELKRLKLRRSDSNLSEVALTFGYVEIPDFYAAVGSGAVTLGQVMRKLIPVIAPDKETLISRIIQKEGNKPHSVRVSGLDNLVISIADCCNPLPGDPIIGFQTKGHGLYIHRTDCRNVAQLIKDETKVVSVAWDVEREDRFKTRIYIVADDRPNMLRDATQALAVAKVNIIKIEMHMEDKLAVGYMIIEVQNLPHLTRIITKLNQIRGIIKAERQGLSAEDVIKNEQGQSIAG